ncbi:DUF7146 domain-containing protein [Neisseria animalis]|uniref:DNA primase/helicase Gp4 N-terminal Bacteriophage T7-like domain-containing protein n=1 Tax=Neisseria animalis TaxID=492 RepID=A0A5P3MRU1_NEIAN|nr:toprim domain-containing protein [Neisseria animalis]QEY23815.1 hypothetical protein D0T90_04270 [Neisseria animalis]ROW31594.1 hypothetical protein CGZ60_09470 [Neisseria animalis]VEE09782.1 putative prophage DNA primase [Neisseria animalis]
MTRKTYDLNDIKAAAYGRWPEIHAALGIPAEYLNTRKHQPCPYCGGRDRYRYTDHRSGGGFICNQCTPDGGSGFDLLMLVFGYDFARAVNEVAALLGYAADTGAARPTPRIPPAAQPAPVTDKQAALAALWQQAQPLTGSPAARYLQARGISPEIISSAANICFHAALPYWTAQRHNGAEAGALFLGNHPAMLAAVTDTAGNLQGLHKTYLQYSDSRIGKLQAVYPDTDEPLPAKKMQSRHAGALTGAAVHLAAPDTQGRLIVAEGIETALAAMELFQIPAIAALSAHGMKSLQWPPSVKELFICADHDHSNTGMKAARDLSVRAVKTGIAARIWQPESAGHDALDELNARKTGEIS